jgi:hypothetical protein
MARHVTIGNVLRALANPALMRREILRRRPGAPLVERMNHEALGRNDYAYAMYHAALQAKALGLNAVSALEFGVAGGSGLRAMEQIAWCIQREVGVHYELFGFDTCTGMPPPQDHRDMPYVWATGQFAPHAPLHSVLKRATMVVGDISATVGEFISTHRPPPLAFVSIDVDYYSSSVHALSILQSHSSFLLPRTFVYLDDIVGDDHELHSEFTGELAAVENFNRSNEQRKIARIHGLRWKRPIPATWNDQMFVAHIFDHPRYNDYTNPRWSRPAADTTDPAVVVRIADASLMAGGPPSPPAPHSPR